MSPLHPEFLDDVDHAIFSAVVMRDPRFAIIFAADTYGSSFMVPKSRTGSPTTFNTALHLMPFLYLAFVMDRKPFVMLLPSFTNRHNAIFFVHGAMVSGLCAFDFDKQCNKGPEPKTIGSMMLMRCFHCLIACALLLRSVFLILGLYCNDYCAVLKCITTVL